MLNERNNLLVPLLPVRHFLLILNDLKSKSTACVNFVSIILVLIKYNCSCIYIIEMIIY
jgi:hypothetical protein